MTEDVTLQNELRALRDRHEIWELVVRYALAIDDGDYAGLADLFVSDAAFHGLNGEAALGRDGVLAYLEERSRVNRGQIHMPTSVVVGSLESDRAEGIVSCYASHLPPEGTASLIALRYEDQYVKQDLHWRFKSRRLHSVKEIIAQRTAP